MRFSFGVGNPVAEARTARQALSQGTVHGIRHAVEDGVEYLYHANNKGLHKSDLEGNIIWSNMEVRPFVIPTMRDFIPLPPPLKRHTIPMLERGAATEERNARSRSSGRA
jgi:hypothetical protein